MGLCYYLSNQDHKESKESTEMLTKIMINETDTEEETDIEEAGSGYLGWIPLFNLMAYIFFFNLGYGSMVWITVAEILPAHTRSITNSISVGFTCIASFIVTYIFPHMKAAITRHGTFWFFGASSVAGFIFIALFVPETK